jgi:hypothetical protein
MAAQKKKPFATFIAKGFFEFLVLAAGLEPATP